MVPDMNSRTCLSDGAEANNDQAESDALRRLGDAVAHLGGDSTWILDTLAETVSAMKPIQKDGLTEEQKQYLIEAGDFSPEELGRAISQVNRGSLKVGAAEAFLARLYETVSLEDISEYLEWDEEAIRRAVAEGELLAVEIAGRLRFPAWQLSRPQPEGLLPELKSLLESASRRWDWLGLTAFMSTPQEELVIKGRQTPAEFLRRGGSINEVRSIIESWEWR
jgi:hypothetical protein